MCFAAFSGLYMLFLRCSGDLLPSARRTMPAMARSSSAGRTALRACARDMRRPAPCEQEDQLAALPFPRTR